MLHGAQSPGITVEIFDECYHLSTEFVKIQFGHGPRDRKYVAHELARFAKGTIQNVWIDEPPDMIIPLLLVSDVTLISSE
jgi:hypothetical protein